MTVVHIPRISGTFGGVVIPRAVFDGARNGLGVFCARHHGDIAGVGRDLRRLAAAQGCAVAGEIALPAGTLFGMEMPKDPARLFAQLGLDPTRVREQINAINLNDPGEDDLRSRWRSFLLLNQHTVDDSAASEAEREAFGRLRSEEVGVNSLGSVVVETPFGRAFSVQGAHHAEWQRHDDGALKGKGGRGSLFFRMHEETDAIFLARTLLGRLNRESGVVISSRSLEQFLAVSETPNGPRLGMEEFRELIEQEMARARGGDAVRGRAFAQAASIGLPPHDNRNRSGRRVVFAQYSTPPAVGEIAAEFLRPQGRSILEPTIGNGVFASASYAAGGLIQGIEIDERRIGRVRTALPDAIVALGDAKDPEIYPASAATEDGRFDAVIANPPFGEYAGETPPPPVTFDLHGIQFRPGHLETFIAASAVSRLRPGGHAVLVMPAQMMKPEEFTVDAKRFQNVLNSVFDKVDTVVLDSPLYRSMGSDFPVMVHFCAGLRDAGNARPVAEAAALAPERLTVLATYESFYAAADAIIAQSGAAPLSAAEIAARRERFMTALGLAVPPAALEDDEAAPDAAPEEGAPSGPSGDQGGAGAGSGTGSGQGSGGRGRRGAGQGTRAPAEAVDDEPEVPPPPASPEPPLARPADQPMRAWFVDDYLPDQFTVPYVPRSQKGSTLAVIERTMANETYAALRRVEEARGVSVDEYVAAKMGFTKEQFLSDRVMFFPEQVDSLALSFARREEKRATIIGDQMGVGKGIQLAAHAYAALAVEDRPVFFATNRHNLFSDFCIRDMRNASGRRFLDLVEGGTVRPFIFNAESALREREEVVFRTSAQDRADAQRTKSLGQANLILMTYSQVQTTGGAWRLQVLKDWISQCAEAGKPPLLLFDEVHKAAGVDSRTGMVVQELIAHAMGRDAEVVYSSATSLKSGRNLPVYSPALPDTGLSQEELLIAIEKMPLAMQEVLASEMALDGALIERKMSDAGVTRDLVILADLDTEKMQAARDASDRVSYLLQDLASMGPQIEQAARRQAARAVGGGLIAGSIDKLRVETTSVASQLDSFSRYLMGAVKGQFIQELMETYAARGEKISAVCEYTGDSVAEYVIGAQLPLLSDPRGVVVPGHPTIGDVVRRYAEKALTFKVIDGFGNPIEMRVDGFDGWLSSFMDQVDQADLGALRVNVFDKIREIAETMDMTVEDITGRKYEFRQGEDGLIRAFAREQPETSDAVARYNEGRTDILCLNSGSATGVSAQASPAHGGDLRRRVMIKLAYQREITDERQVEGRVHRAGQIVPPRYVIPVTGFAADDRIANLFNRANRSLTASTSATRENKTNATHAVDILNPIGERAVAAVLARNPDIAEVLQINTEGGTDLARKLLGRSVMLPLDRQSAILSEVDSTFHVISDTLTAEGNNPLLLNRYQWDAEVRELEELIPGDPQAHGVASRALVLNSVTYREPVESLGDQEIINGILDRRSATDPFENMHTAWDYPKAIQRGRPNFEHHLFGSVTGRRTEGMRMLWPLPLPGRVSEHLMVVVEREMADIERKRGRPANNDEFRAFTEEYGARLSDAKLADYGFADYRKEVVAKHGEDAFETTRIAVGLRALWNRTQQIKRLDNVLPLIEPGRMIALDVRALSPREGGMWSSAYRSEDVVDGLVPAIITTATYAGDAPFAESRMSFRIFVPGGRMREGLTVSALHSSLEAVGASGVAPIRPITELVSRMSRPRNPSLVSQRQEADYRAFRSLMGPETFEAVQARLEGLRSGGEELSVVVGGSEVRPAGRDLFKTLVQAMPREAVKRERFTLEGNLFAAMSVASSTLGANSGEKIVYTDKEGNHRNAILLNERSSKQLVESIRKKVARRSVVHSGLTTPEAVSDYLRVTNALQFGLAYHDTDGEKEVIEALGRFYPKAFAGGRGERALEEFPATISAIRGRMQTVERTFPASVMAGGDVWRWATDIEQKASMSKDIPRGYLTGVGGPATFRVTPAREEHVLGYREVAVQLSVEPHALAVACGAIDRTQTLVLHLERGKVAVVVRKEHPALAGQDGRSKPDNDQKALLDRFQQEVMGSKLKSGVLAATFSLVEKSDRDVVTGLLFKQAGAGRMEILIGGAMKMVQNGLNEEVAARRRAEHQALMSLDEAELERRASVTVGGTHDQP